MHNLDGEVETQGGGVDLPCSKLPRFLSKFPFMCICWQNCSGTLGLAPFGDFVGFLSDHGESKRRGGNFRWRGGWILFGVLRNSSEFYVFVQSFVKLRWRGDFGNVEWRFCKIFNRIMESSSGEVETLGGEVDGFCSELSGILRNLAFLCKYC